MIPAGDPPPPSQAPHVPLPPGAVDAHFHMLADPADFPLWDKRVEDPATGLDYEDWLAALNDHMTASGFEKGVLVHSILYGDDNSLTLETLKRLGPGFRAVGLLPDNSPPQALDPHAQAGVVALRLNYVHGGVLSWDGAKRLAPALSDRNMHLQMLLHADQHIDALADDIRALPVPLVVDHCAWPSGSLDPYAPGIEALCALLAEGHIYVKLTALYRLCDPPFTQADALVARLISANPDHCLWGSDWPYIMRAGRPQPRTHDLIGALQRVAGDRMTKILVTTPNRLFSFSR